jgi:hypothetical protein
MAKRNSSKNKKAGVHKEAKVSKLTEDEVSQLITKPVAKAKPIFDYLAQWRSQSLKSHFSFG